MESFARPSGGATTGAAWVATSFMMDCELRSGRERRARECRRAVSRFGVDLTDPTHGNRQLDESCQAVSHCAWHAATDTSTN